MDVSALPHPERTFTPAKVVVRGAGVRCNGRRVVGLPPCRCVSI